MSISTFSAAPVSAAPTRNVTPPPNMDHLRPATRVTVAAKKDATSAARYSEEVNMVSSWLSNLQYWLLWFFSASCSLWYTDGKNFIRNGFIDVTPPEHCTASSALFLFFFFSLPVSGKNVFKMILSLLKNNWCCEK
jgi:hypothetical protein